MLQEGQVGPQTLAPGARSILRQGPSGEMNVGDAHARYQEAVYRGNVYAVADQAAVTIPAGLSTAPTTVTLFNPKGNNKLAGVWYGAVTSLVAWTAAAAVWIAGNRNIAEAAPTGTAAAAQNQMIGNANAASILAFTTATLAVAPVAIRLLGAGLTGAITTIPQVHALGGWLDGSIILAPGGNLAFAASTASGAGAFGCWVWEEVPI